MSLFLFCFVENSHHGLQLRLGWGSRHKCPLDIPTPCLSTCCSHCFTPLSISPSLQVSYCLNLELKSDETTSWICRRRNTSLLSIYPREICACVPEEMDKNLLSSIVHGKKRSGDNPDIHHCKMDMMCIHTME